MFRARASRTRARCWGLIDHFGVFVPPGRTPEEMRGIPDAPQIRSVSHDFLQTMGVRLLAGRWLEPRDDGGAPPVIVVNRSLATRFFGSDDPVGQLVHLDGRMDLPPQQVVGVVDDMRQARLDQEPAPQFFVDYRQVLALTQARQMPVPAQERLAFGFLSFVVRTDGDPARLITDGAIADRPGGLQRRDRRAAPDGPTRGVFAHSPAVLCSRHGRVCRDSRAVERGWHLRRTRLRRRATSLESSVSELRWAPEAETSSPWCCVRVSG